MTPKSTLGKTERFSGLASSVKNAQPKEEPRITKEQITEAFNSFDLPINDRGHNDVALWTTRGASELPKLIQELSKKRKEINQKEDDSRKSEELRTKAQKDFMAKHDESKMAMPRLSDNEISALFDEYGLPTPDPEWARNHLPNDPKKIRSILEMQRKTADDMLKKHSKNTVNAIPEVAKMGGAPMTSSPAPMMGQGGPTPNPMGMQGEMTPSTTPVKPFFIGDHAIVRIANQNNPNITTTWLVDTKKKILRPFSSEKAFRNAFEDPDEAEKSVTSISSRDLDTGGVLEGFTPLKGDQGVRDDGSMDRIDFSQAQLQDRYGKQEDPEAEKKSLTMLDGIFGQLNKPQQ